MKWFLAFGWICLLAPALQAAPFLEGRVTDEKGNPIAEASVKIWDCVGTCLGGHTVLTDDNGHYVFEEKTFRNFPSLAISMPGRYEVSREEFGPQLHEPDTETPRKVNFVLGTPAAANVRVEGKAPEGWTQSLIIRPGRETKVRRYDAKGEVQSGWNRWYFSMLPREETLHLVLVRQPVAERNAWRERIEIISNGFQLTHPQIYSMKATVVEGTDQAKPYLQIESIYDALGEVRTEELAEAGGIYGPPVDAEKRQQALDLLERVEEAARPWNALPPKSIVRYEYDVLMKDKEKIHVQRDQNSPSGPSWSDISRVRGFAYMPPLRWLFSQPENVDFYRVEIGEDQATLVYKLKENRGYGVGLGVGSGWYGFTNGPFSTGRILIDLPTATVVEHRYSKSAFGDEYFETFSDYRAVEGGYAPEKMRIKTSNHDLRLKFEIHENRLWLVKEASYGEGEPVMQIDNVRVELSES